MPFANFDSIGAVARTYRIVVRDETFVTPLDKPVSDALRGDLAFVHEHGPATNSEAARCENLISPILKGLEILCGRFDVLEPRAA